MTAATHSCPEGGELASFVERGLDAARESSIREHLDGCEDCVEALLGWLHGSRLGGVVANAEMAGADIPSGTRVGAFEIDSLLGAGNLGRVYLARDTRLERDVALKLLGVRSDHPSWADRLVLEAQTMARIRHPNVCTVYEVGRDDELVFVAMERIEGQTLRQAQAMLTQAQLLDVLAGAANGLAAAHEQGVTHRDLKPDNIMLEAAGDGWRAVVCDFGLAAAGTAARPESPTDQVEKTISALVGTPAYMAPEQIEGAAIDQRADVFAFGVTAWELLSGARPFDGMTIDDIRARQREPLSWPAAVTAPLALRALLLECLSEQPEKRISSSELAARLSAIVGSSPLSRRERLKRVAFALAAAMVVALALTLFFVLRSDSDNSGGACEALAYNGWPVSRESWRSDNAAATNLPAWFLADVTRLFDERANAWRASQARQCQTDSKDAVSLRLWSQCQQRTTKLEAAYFETLGSATWPNAERLKPLADELPLVTYCDTEEALQMGVSLSSATGSRDLVERHLLEATLLSVGQASTPPWNEVLRRAQALAVSLEDDKLNAALAFVTARLTPAGSTPERDKQWRHVVAMAEGSGNERIAARAWIVLAHLWVETEPNDRRAALAIEQADWAVKRLGDPARLRSSWFRAAAGHAWQQGHVEEARTQFARAIEVAAGDAAAQRSATLALAKLATISEDHASARRLYEAVLVDPRTQTSSKASQAQLHSAYAEVLYQSGDLEGGSKMIETALVLAGDELKDDDPRIGEYVLVRGMLELERGEITTCLASTELALAILVAAYGRNHSSVGAAYNLRASAQAASGDHEAALATAGDAKSVFASLYGPSHEAAIFASSTVASNLDMLKRYDEARTEFEDALKRARAAFGPTHSFVSNMESALAGVLFELGETEQAIGLAESALKATRASQVAPPYVGQSELNLARILAKTDRPRAIRLTKSALEKWRGDAYWESDSKAAKKLLSKLVVRKRE